MGRTISDNKKFAGKYLSKSVAGDSSVTLTAGEYENGIMEFTGVLTGSINVVVPLTAGLQWIVFNNTTGAYTITVKGSTGTGVAVTQTKKVILYTNGSEVYAASSEV
jgi:hypothetical protein